MPAGRRVPPRTARRGPLALGSLSSATDPASPTYAYPGVAYPASKAAVKMITVQFAKAFPNMRINAFEPGFTKTDLNGNTGIQTVEQAAVAHGADRLRRPYQRLFRRPGHVPVMSPSAAQVQLASAESAPRSASEATPLTAVTLLTSRDAGLVGNSQAPGITRDFPA